jgi:cation diffusion facilitator CzcD-associated flavoprotein CzcO
MERRTVAVIGAGPSGIIAARYLRAHGFEPTVFELSDDIGGQWNGRSPNSGIWPNMRTNTSRVMTQFSDLGYEAGVATYPSNQEVRAYLRRYSELFGLTSLVRARTRVELVETDQQGYRVTLRTEQKASNLFFDFVVAASGRYNKPYIPPVPGLASFTGTAGARHSFYYKDPERYRGLRVLVAGCAISALEIASDLAMLGASKVVSCYRRQRYVLPKLAGGVPSDHVFFTRWAALAAETFPVEVTQAALKKAILQFNGSPEQYGATKPDDDVTKAGITLSQYFLPLVAEKRIEVKPWIREIRGEVVAFEDGSEQEFDAILFSTGFELNLPYLSEEMREKLRVDNYSLDLYRYTFSPDFKGLAFMGMHDQTGPIFPVLELQARWITYAWSGVVRPPTDDQMREAIRQFQPVRGARMKTFVHQMALAFSREIGTEPQLSANPELTRAAMFGPLAAVSFRIWGPEPLSEAAERFQKEAREFGAVPTCELTHAQKEQLQALERGRSRKTAADAS